MSYWNGTFLTLSSNTTVSFWGDNGAGHTGDACELYPCNLLTQNINQNIQRNDYKDMDDSQITKTMRKTKNRSMWIRAHLAFWHIIN